MAAVIQISTGGPPVTGSVETTASTLCTFSNLDNTSVAGWFWELLDRPAGSAATLSSTTNPTTTITPDVPGTYLVRLTTYFDSSRTLFDDSDEQGVGVRFTTSFTWRLPAARETQQFDANDGWKVELNAILTEIRTALLSGGGGDCCDYVFQPGGTPDPTKNIYDDWGDLYTDASAEPLPPRVLMDDQFAPVTIPAGTYTLDGWTLQSANQLSTTVYLADGANVNVAAGGTAIRLSRIALQPDPGGMTGPVFNLANNYPQSLRLVLEDSSIIGDSTNLVAMIDAKPLGGGQASVTFEMTRASSVLSWAVDADNAAGITDLNVVGWDAAVLAESAFQGSCSSLSLSAQSPLANLSSSPALTATIGKSYAAQGGDRVRLPIMGTVVGTAETTVGAIRLAAGAVIAGDSYALLGTLGVADTATLRLRRFTGGTLIATWTATGLLQDSQLAAATVVAATEDWYYFTLAAGGAAQTAIVQGAHLNIYSGDVPPTG